MTKEIKKKRMRKDRERNMWKVIKSIINDPLKTQKEIAEEVGIWIWNVNRKLNELERNGIKDPRILAICDKDLDIVTLWQEEIYRRLSKNPKIMTTRDIVATMETGTRRYTLFRWDITDEKWWLKFQLTEEQLKRLNERLEIDE